MPCLKPIRAYQSITKLHESGKGQLFFDHKKAGPSVRVDLPCGQCIGCRIDKSRTWAIRCVHEASLYSSNCFVTLTFNSDNLDVNKSLVKSDFQNFMKRLRKNYNGIDAVEDIKGRITFPIRYFHCGEYGTNFSRPHHHACIFNFDFDDKQLWSHREGVRLYRSEKLEKLWPFGYSTIGEVTSESAAYVARYCIKKITGDAAASHYITIDETTGELTYIEPEYITMSRRPGIGKNWFKRYQNDVYPKDFITDSGKVFKTPRYYDKLYDLDQPENFSQIRKKRLTKAKQYADNNTNWRLRGRLKAAENKFKQTNIRSYENGITNF